MGSRLPRGACHLERSFQTSTEPSLAPTACRGWASAGGTFGKMFPNVPDWSAIILQVGPGALGAEAGPVAPGSIRRTSLCLRGA